MYGGRGLCANMRQTAVRPAGENATFVGRGLPTSWIFKKIKYIYIYFKPCYLMQAGVLGLTVKLICTCFEERRVHLGVPLCG